MFNLLQEKILNAAPAGTGPYCVVFDNKLIRIGSQYLINKKVVGKPLRCSTRDRVVQFIVLQKSDDKVSDEVIIDPNVVIQQAFQKYVNKHTGESLLLQPSDITFDVTLVDNILYIKSNIWQAYVNYMTMSTYRNINPNTVVQGNDTSLMLKICGNIDSMKYTMLPHLNSEVLNDFAELCQYMFRTKYNSHVTMFESLLKSTVGGTKRSNMLVLDVKGPGLYSPLTNHYFVNNPELSKYKLFDMSSSSTKFVNTWGMYTYTLIDTLSFCKEMSLSMKLEFNTYTAQTLMYSRLDDLSPTYFPNQKREEEVSIYKSLLTGTEKYALLNYEILIGQQYSNSQITKKNFKQLLALIASAKFKEVS